MAARKLHNLIYATIGNCCLYIVLCSIALGTNKWFSGSTNEIKIVDNTMKVTLSYGLFSGTKTKTSGGSSEEFKLKIVCQGTEGCMFSCGISARQRNKDIQDLIAGRGANDAMLCRDTGLSSLATLKDGYAVKAENSPIFINFGLYLLTIMFLCLGMIFAILSGVFALYNTYRTPIQPVLSVLGLYIWNGISAAFVLLAMIMWVIEFGTGLRKNAAISDTLNGDHDSSGRGSLGVSFWILILPICFSLANIALLRYRSWKIVKMDENNVTVMTEKLESGDILLF